MSEAREALEQHGYLARRRSATDRRVVEIHLSKLGRAAVSAQSPPNAARLAQVLGRLDDEARRSAVAGLTSLARAAREAQLQRNQTKRRSR